MRACPGERFSSEVTLSREAVVSFANAAGLDRRVARQDSGQDSKTSLGAKVGCWSPMAVVAWKGEKPLGWRWGSEQ